MTTRRPRARHVILAALAAPFAVAALGQLLAPDATLLSIWIASATPLAYLPAYGVLVLGLIFRSRAAVALSGLAALCHLLWVGPTLIASSAEPDPSAECAPVRVLTANLLYVNEERYPLAYELADAEADVLVLEEVSPRWLDQLDGRTLRTFYPGRDLVVRDDAFGIAILSRYPLTRSEVVDLGGVPMLDATLAGC